MIKELITAFHCKRCDDIFEISREILVDDYTKEIILNKPICKCGNSTRSKFKIVDVEIRENGQK